HVDLDELVDERREEIEPRVRGRMVLAEPEHEPFLVLRHDARAARQDDQEHEREEADDREADRARRGEGHGVEPPVGTDCTYTVTPSMRSMRTVVPLSIAGPSAMMGCARHSSPSNRILPARVGVIVSTTRAVRPSSASVFVGMLRCRRRLRIFLRPTAT